MYPASDSRCRSIIKFDGENYRIWRKTVEADLSVLGIYEGILPSFDMELKVMGSDATAITHSESAAMTDSDKLTLVKLSQKQKIKNRAFSYLLNSLAPRQLELVQEADTPAETPV